MRPTILPIVEGQSEVQAIPVLLRRLLERLGRTDAGVAQPFRVKRTQAVRPGEIERAVDQGIRARGDVTAILVVLDADDDSPERLEASLLARCQAATHLPCAVVAATSELEAWFLGSKDALRGVCGIRQTANAPDHPEEIRGAKERLSRNMEGRRYVPVIDQPRLAARMDLELTLQRCASFSRLATALERLLLESGQGASGTS
jgi:hypothetical protein